MKSMLFMNLGVTEIVIIALVVLLLFGGKKIPELMRGLGKGVRSFKDGMNDKADGVETLKFGAVFVNTKENTSAIPCAVYIKDESKKAGQIFVKVTAEKSLKLSNLTGPNALYKGAPYMIRE